VKEIEGTSNGKSEKEETAEELQNNTDNRYHPRSRLDDDENLSGCYAYS
jgi:hypothetical protein